MSMEGGQRVTAWHGLYGCGLKGLLYVHGRGPYCQAGGVGQIWAVAREELSAILADGWQ